MILLIGLSGLTTAVQGSIVHGTPTQPPATPLDLSPLRHHRSPATTPVSYSPSNSPALDMIQEEHPVEIPRVNNLNINFIIILIYYLMIFYIKNIIVKMINNY